MPILELATLASEKHFLVGLSGRLGIPYSTMLDTLWSSDVSMYRASALVEAAQQEIAQEIRDAEAAKRDRRRKGRRR